MTTIWRGENGERISVECWNVDQLLEHTDERFWSLFKCDCSPRLLPERSERIKKALQESKCLPLPEIACNSDGTVCSIQDGQRRIAVAKELKRESMPVIVYYSPEGEKIEHVPMSCEQYEELTKYSRIPLGG